MSSREIAEITGKRHSDVLNAIRKMEFAWKNITGRNFSLSEYIDQSGRKLPEIILNKTESMYVGSKFNDEARAKLVLRWEALEVEKQSVKPLSQLEILAQSTQILIEQDKRIGNLESKINQIENQSKTT
nr:Rha family transcriptional regulator [uncultured Chryseobacterium sp.]